MSLLPPATVPAAAVPDLRTAEVPRLRTPTVVQGLAFHRDPYRFLLGATARHGDVVGVDLPVSGPAVVVAAPEDVERLTSVSASVARAGQGRRHVLGMVSPASVLGSDPPEHALLRGRVAPAFDPARVARLSEEVDRVVRQHLRAWPRDRPTRLVERCRVLADHVFALVMLGITDEVRGPALARAVRAMLATPGNPPLPPPSPDDGALGAVAQVLYDRRTAPVERLLLAEVAERRWGLHRAPTDASALLDGQDVISCVLDEGPQGDRALLDQLVPLVVAGQEPPAMGLTWVLDRLAREEGRAASLAGDDPGAREGRDRFVAEALRVRPPVHSLLRDLREPVEVSGTRLEAGTTVMLPMVLTHADPRTFTDPGTFRPERWGSLPEQPDGYRPFGAGAHRCIGEPLARLLLDRAVAAAAEEVRLVPLLPRTERMVVRATVTAPVHGAPVMVRARPGT
ncbi:cytochrome P450 [Aquipuribacter hungaricus]|uniref:Cytochrome P450 n=1 Tax=Aquipuribacter hungaricus TaxID=545624 RepID=A0ABV7WDZ6_9MICO